MEEIPQILPENEARLNLLLTTCAIFSVTGRREMLAWELAEVMKRDRGMLHFDGFEPTLVSGEFGRSFIKEVEEGVAQYDFTNGMIFRTSRRIDIRRLREDGSEINAVDYDLNTILNDDEMLIDALRRGFINYNRVITEIVALVGDIDGISHIELQDRVAVAIEHLITKGGFVFDDISQWRNNEIIIKDTYGAHPFSAFDWEGSLNASVAIGSSADMLVTYQELPPTDIDTPFPGHVSLQGDHLQRVIAQKNIRGAKALSVVDCLRGIQGEVTALSEETRVYEEGALPKMLVGRSALWREEGELKDRNVLEYWAPTFGSRRGFEGYAVTFYDIYSFGYVTRLISPEDYMGPNGDVANVTDGEVPSIARKSTVLEIRAYLEMVGSYPFIRRAMVDDLYEYFSPDELEDDS